MGDRPTTTTTTSLWEVDAPMFYDFGNTSGNSSADTWFDRHLGFSKRVYVKLKNSSAEILRVAVGSVKSALLETSVQESSETNAQKTVKSNTEDTIAGQSSEARAEEVQNLITHAVRGAKASPLVKHVEESVRKTVTVSSNSKRSHPIQNARSSNEAPRRSRVSGKENVNPTESNTVSVKKHVHIVEPLPASYGSPVRRSTYTVEESKENPNRDTLVLSAAASVHDQNGSIQVETGAINNTGSDNPNTLQLTGPSSIGQTPANLRDIGQVMDSAQAILENLQQELYGRDRVQESPMQHYRSSVSSSFVTETPENSAVEQKIVASVPNSHDVNDSSNRTVVITKASTTSIRRSTAVDALISKRLSQKNSRKNRSARTTRIEQHAGSVSGSDDDDDDEEPDSNRDETTATLPQDADQGQNVTEVEGSGGDQKGPKTRSAESAAIARTEETPAKNFSSSAAKTPHTASTVKTPRGKTSGWGYTPRYRREYSNRQSPILTRSLAKRESLLPMIVVNTNEDASHSEYVTADEDENALDNGNGQKGAAVNFTDHGKSRPRDSEHPENSSAVAQGNTVTGNLSEAPSISSISVASGVTYTVSSDSYIAKSDPDVTNPATIVASIVDTQREDIGAVSDTDAVVLKANDRIAEKQKSARRRSKSEGAKAVRLTVPASPAFSTKKRSVRSNKATPFKSTNVPSVAVVVADVRNPKTPTRSIVSQSDARKKLPIDPSKIKPFSFVEKEKELQLRRQEKLEAKRKALYTFPTFKAQAMPVGLPFVPVKSQLPATEIQPFTLLTDERGTKYQQQFQEQIDKEMEALKKSREFKAHGMPQMDSVWKPNTSRMSFSIEIKPFEFATDERAKQWQKIEGKKAVEQGENEQKRLQLEAEKADKEREEIRQERKRREFHPKKRYHPYTCSKQ